MNIIYLVVNIIIILIPFGIH